MRMAKPFRIASQISRLYDDAIARFYGMCVLFDDYVIWERNRAKLSFLILDLYRQILLLEQKIDNFLKYYSKLNRILSRDMRAMQISLMNIREKLEKLIGVDGVSKAD